MENSLLLVYNPVSGKGNIKTFLADIISIYTDGGYCVTVHPTACPLDGYSYIERHGKDYDVVSVCGGDGMLNEAVSAFMSIDEKHRPTLAYLPSGSTNDFAGTVGLPLDLRRAARQVVDGAPFYCDAGMFNNRYFAYVAAFGAFTSVAYDTAQEFKNVFGHLAYVMEGIRRLPTIKPYHIKVSFNDTVIEDDFLFGMVTNSLQVGGIKRVSGTAISLNDGLFEVLLVKKPQNPIEFQNMITAFLMQTFDAKGLISFKTSYVKFECSENLSWTLDGEFGGNCTHAEIKNIQRGFAVIV